MSEGDVLREGVAAVLAAAGLAVMGAALLGGLRAPDIYVRAHAARLALGAGAPLLLAALAVAAWDGAATLRLAAIGLALAVAGPAAIAMITGAAHGLGQAAATGPNPDRPS
ncbi:MAG: monovalent cation/H(+) antiporter subunit G [Hyphomonadaceae bacterium]|nr:monovalent cation/H(+) antiporter subunit G [Hyphomonadaceae bacterium]